MNDYEKIVADKWEEFQKDLKSPNILLLGQTGCGKSSLVNYLFGANIALTNDVYRGTIDFKYYKGKEYGTGVNIIDSRGYEYGDKDSYEKYMLSIRDEIEIRKKNPDQMVHLVWYAISEASHRIEPMDINILNELMKIPDIRHRVAVVYTKCDESSADGSTTRIFDKIIREEVDGNLPTFETSTDEDLACDLDFNKLVQWSANNIDDEDMKNAFIISQKTDLDAKKALVNKSIAGYMAAAAGVAATPIPFSDAALLTPIQIGMATHITRIYAMNNIGGLSKAILSQVIISNMGKSLAANIIKLIPGAGTAVGAVVNAGVASVLTGAIGRAISEICYSYCQDVLAGKDVDIYHIFDAEIFSQAVTAQLGKRIEH